MTEHGINHDAEDRMAQDVEENPELYDALADGPEYTVLDASHVSLSCDLPAPTLRSRLHVFQPVGEFEVSYEWDVRNDVLAVTTNLHAEMLEYYR